MERRFIVHITGTNPHKIDKVIGPYVTEAVARSTAYAHYALSKPEQDWIGEVFRLDFDNLALDRLGLVLL